MSDKMNNTLLDPMRAATINGPIHRDYLSHSLRWEFVSRLLSEEDSFIEDRVLELIGALNGQDINLQSRLTHSSMAIGSDLYRRFSSCFKQALEEQRKSCIDCTADKTLCLYSREGLVGDYSFTAESWRNFLNDTREAAKVKILASSKTSDVDRCKLCICDSSWYAPELQDMDESKKIQKIRGILEKERRTVAATRTAEKNRLDKKTQHRDYIQHCLRWAFVGRLIGSNEVIADIGAGVGNLEETLWRNKLRPKTVYAVEVHPAFIEKLKELKTKLNYHMDVIEHDIRKMPLPLQNNVCDTVTCFEVVEHFDQKHLNFVLSELARVVKPDGRVLLSTPNYDGIHKAENHIHEYTEAELQQELEKHFIIVRKFGTFMSTGLPKQAKLVLTPGDYNLFMRLREYYSPNLLSVLFAPVYPSQSRNILWVLKKKVVVEDDSHPFSELITPEDMDSTPA